MKQFLSILQLSLLIFTSAAGAGASTAPHKTGVWQETQQKLSLAAPVTNEAAPTQRDIEPDDASVSGDVTAHLVPSEINANANTRSFTSSHKLALPSIRGPPLS